LQNRKFKKLNYILKVEWKTFDFLSGVEGRGCANNIKSRKETFDVLSEVEGFSKSPERSRRARLRE
jgi:hypothetical protein